jgi:DNA-directed RNA polymerase subunit E'/Rpb7
LLLQIKDNLEGRAFKEYGYIIDVFKIEGVNDALITEDGDVLLEVLFRCLAFKPGEGDVYDMVVEKGNLNHLKEKLRQEIFREP